MQCLRADGVQIVELTRVLLSIMHAVMVTWGCGSCAVGLGPVAWRECSVMAGSVKG